MQSENFNILKMSNAEKKDFRKKKIEKFKKKSIENYQKGLLLLLLLHRRRKEKVSELNSHQTFQKGLLYNEFVRDSWKPPYHWYLYTFYFLFYIIDLKIWGKIYPKNIHSRKTTTSIHPLFILGCICIVPIACIYLWS